MSFEHPLAYLLGIEGIALLRAYTGEHDRAFVEARIAEIRRLLDDPALPGAGLDVADVDTVDGYRIWSATYDAVPNSAFDLDRPVVDGILDTVPAGVALDAACGSGRYAEALAGRGHRVIGVDSSPDMLDRARRRVPDGDFRRGDLTALPVADHSVDLVVCTLALTHVADPRPVLAEFARVVRGSGHVVLSDIHPEAVARGSIPKVRGPDGAPGRLPAHRHLVGDYLRAALEVSLRPRRCEEVPRHARPAEPPAEASAAAPASADIGPWDLWPWTLDDLVPDAARAANAGSPALLVWHFQPDEHR